MTIYTKAIAAKYLDQVLKNVNPSLNSSTHQYALFTAGAATAANLAAGNVSNELSGNGYARVTGFNAFQAPNATGQYTTNNQLITFPNPTADWARAGFLGIFDSAGTTLLYFTALKSAQTAKVGKPIVFQVGTVSVFLNGVVPVTTTAVTPTITGGTVSYSGAYKIHKFTTSSNLVISGSGTASIEYLMVAGGGGSTFGGGGGAGGVLTGTANLTAGTFSVVIGAGGAGGASWTNGSNSTFNSLTAVGGGKGGDYNQTGFSGGSGGGGCSDSTTKAGGAAQSGQGYAGGSGVGKNAAALSGGGGGAGAPGGNADPNYGLNGRSGDGGIGIQSSITGTATYYAGGGGGNSSDTYAPDGAGGLGGGGAASENGTVNTGGGAGGYSHTGGSGVVIIRYVY